MTGAIIFMILLITLLVFSVLIAPGIALIIIFSIRKKRNAVNKSDENVIEATFTDPDACEKEATEEEKGE